MPAISHSCLFWKCSVKIVPKLVWEIIIYFWVKSQKVTMKKDCHFMILRNDFLILTKKFIMTSRTWTELGRSSIFLSLPSYFKMKKATLKQRPIKMPSSGLGGEELKCCLYILHIDLIQRQVDRACSVSCVFYIINK